MIKEKIELVLVNGKRWERVLMVLGRTTIWVK